MPEDDAVHRAAERLKVLEGEIVSVETPHPRAAVLGLAERLDGRRLERVEAVGKHILLGFEGGLLLRSHLRMRGRWSVRAAGSRPRGTPWRVLRGRRWQATLWNGPVLQLTRRHSPIVARLGPDIMAEPPDLHAMLGGLRSADGTRELGEILLDQGLVSGIGNKWKAEALFAAPLSPWTRLRDVPEDGLRRVLEAAARLMRAGGGQR
jgi:endonuclease VIII